MNAIRIPDICQTDIIQKREYGDHSHISTEKLLNGTNNSGKITMGMMLIKKFGDLWSRCTGIMAMGNRQGSHFCM